MLKGKYFNYFFIVMLLGSLAVVSGCSDDDEDNHIQENTTAKDMRAAEQKEAAEKAAREAHEAEHEKAGTTPAHDSDHAVYVQAKANLVLAEFNQEDAAGIFKDAQNAQADADHNLIVAESNRSLRFTELGLAQTAFKESTPGSNSVEVRALKNAQNAFDAAEQAEKDAIDDVSTAARELTVAKSNSVFADAALVSAQVAFDVADKALNG